jgi:hypothetical protein
LTVTCIFSGASYGDAVAHSVCGTILPPDRLSCVTPPASLPTLARIQVTANGTTLNADKPSTDIHYYAILSFLPSVGMADGATAIDVDIAGYPQDAPRHLIAPFCRFDAGTCTAACCSLRSSCRNAAHSSLALTSLSLELPTSSISLPSYLNSQYQYNYCTQETSSISLPCCRIVPAPCTVTMCYRS